MNKILREQNETIVKLKGVCPGHRLPQGLLQEGGSAIKTALDTFKHARSVDLINEKRPELSSNSSTSAHPIGPNLKNNHTQPYPQVSQTNDQPSSMPISGTPATNTQAGANKIIKQTSAPSSVTNLSSANKPYAPTISQNGIKANEPSQKRAGSFEMKGNKTSGTTPSNTSSTNTKPKK